MFPRFSTGCHASINSELFAANLLEVLFLRPVSLDLPRTSSAFPHISNNFGVWNWSGFLLFFLSSLAVPLSIQLHFNHPLDSNLRSASPLAFSLWAIFRGCRRKRDRAPLNLPTTAPFPHTPQPSQSAATALCQSSFQVVACLCFSCKAHFLLSIQFSPYFAVFCRFPSLQARFLSFESHKIARFSAYPKQKSFHRY